MQCDNTVNLQTGQADNMRPAQAAHYTGLSESTLAKLRMRHNRADGPNYLKISGCVIYRRSDLDSWMDRFAVRIEQ
ncbi:hypothetical protein BOA8489_03681 [Boseongicola aestuarii]|uniref:Helix-turn-helix domain protein n=1 Tax=Boseongicola aestuarii TaxID=1470561 RepID=A0A238J4J8_9RHOB|nr:hypothetical protein BOA8489_03681 [Boseongicola aestuarii]